MARNRRVLPSKKTLEVMNRVMGLGREAILKQIEDSAPDYDDAKLKKELEAESVLFFIERRGSGVNHFKDQLCKWCKEPFMHTAMGVAYCSDSCRKLACDAVGIIYNPEGKTQFERWGYRIRKVIGVDATEMLAEWIDVNPNVRLKFEEEPEPEPVPEQPTQRASDADYRAKRIAELKQRHSN